MIFMGCLLELQLFFSGVPMDIDIKEKADKK